MNILTIKVDDFNLDKTIQSGQQITYLKRKNSYVLNLNGKNIEISQEKNSLTIKGDITKEEIVDFFELDIDYKKINEEIILNFPELKDIVEFSKGLHFIKEDLLESCIGSIISQNNNLKRIINSLTLLCLAYGENRQFPSLNTLKTLSIEDFNDLGVGFRDKYLYQFCQKIDKNWLENIRTLNTKEAYNELISFKGIGPKVSNCILLFGLGKGDVFPVDTHIKQIMQTLYFKDEEKKEKDIEEFAINKFGKYASYIQQYLFFYKINH